MPLCRFPWRKACVRVTAVQRSGGVWCCGFCVSVCLFSVLFFGFCASVACGRKHPVFLWPLAVYTVASTYSRKKRSRSRTTRSTGTRAVFFFWEQRSFWGALGFFSDFPGCEFYGWREPETSGRELSFELPLGLEDDGVFHHTRNDVSVFSCTLLLSGFVVWLGIIVSAMLLAPRKH